MARPYYEGSPFTSPYSLMRRFFDDVDRLFGTGQGSMSAWPFEGGAGTSLAGGHLWAPTVEVFQRDGRLIVRADLPGLTENDVRIDVEGDLLTIEGERQQEHNETREGVFHSERSYGSFKRSIRLPEGVDVNAISASFDRGVLEVTMPSPQPKLNKHRINVGGAPATPQRAEPARTNAPRSEATRGQNPSQNGTLGGPYPRADGPR